MEDVDVEQALKQVRGASILVAEDSQINQQVIFALLQDAGLFVTLADNGQQAVELARKDSFDAVLMDLQMPVMDGFEATRQIREFLSYDELPILAMTAGGAESNVEQCLAVGMNDHIIKSLNPEVLYRALLKWLEPGERNTAPEPVVADTQQHDADFSSLLPESIDCLEVSRGVENVGGNTQLLLNVYRDFVNDHRDDADRICEALVNQEFELAQRLAHTLNSTSALMGAMSLHESAKALETAIKQGEEASYLVLYADIDACLKPVIDVISPVVDKYASVPVEMQADAEEPLELPELLSQLQLAVMTMSPDAIELSSRLAGREDFSELHQKVSHYDFETAEKLLQPLLEKHGVDDQVVLHNDDERPKVLIVDDERINLNLLNTLLKSEYRLIAAAGGQQALAAVRNHHPDLVLLDIMMPEMDGYEVCQLLKADNLTADIPVMFITAMSDAEDETRCFHLGAVDFISKPFNNAVVQARVRTHVELKRKSDLLAQLISKDGLTGIPNRRAFNDASEREWARAKRLGARFTVAMMDIDMFKQYNDNYGHAMGDDCLIQVAQALHGCGRRPADVIARYGGEEFAALLPETDLEGGITVMEMMLQAVRDLKVPHAFSTAGEHVSISIGVASVVASDDMSFSQLLKEADSQLYAAKEAGRNQIKSIQF